MRRNDPPASHIAADKSQKGLSKLRIAILRMMSQVDSLSGVDANRRYGSLADGVTYPFCAPDSVRKRLGEMADADKGEVLIDVVAHNHGTLEAVYAISPEGRAALAKATS